MPSAVVSAVLAKLQRVKPHGDYWTASCPSHGGSDGDKNPSLSIKEGSDGRALLRCHAGCEAWQIVAAIGMTEAELFSGNEPTSQKRTIQHEYNYCDEQGQLLFQTLRYNPKGFAQRRRDPSGKGWLYNLQGVRRVVYRLNELEGQKSILYCEGEKDCDRAWSLGIPATTSPMGAGKWVSEYAQQLRSRGVQKVAVIPDNDAVGIAHATTVTASLQSIGITVRLVSLPGVPDHGDLSDYLAAGHTKDDLLTLIRQAPIAETVQSSTIAPENDRQFTSLGEGRYQLTIHSLGVVLRADDLERHRDGVSGNLLVRVNGQFPNAKSYKDGVICTGDFNYSSVNARATRAKLLTDRSGDRDFDWFGILEEFVISVTSHQQDGEPPILLAGELDQLEEDESREVWDVDGFPVLTDNPMVLFGDGASGKSYFALWVAGQLAIRHGIKILYADWEYSLAEHRKRLHRLFQPPPKLIDYIRCSEPMAREAQRLKRLIVDHGYQYLICDSIGFAVDGPAETSESASKYFAGLRLCGVGSLSLHHISKGQDGRDPSMFGSVYFRNGARSAWYIDRAAENKHGELNVGLHHKKANATALLKPLAYKYIFDKRRVRIERTDIATIEELQSQLPLVDRLRKHMADGELYGYKDLAEDLGVAADAIRKAIIRSKYFTRINRKVKLKPVADQPVEPVQAAGNVIHHDF